MSGVKVLLACSASDSEIQVPRAAGGDAAGACEVGLGVGRGGGGAIGQVWCSHVVKPTCQAVRR